jgi:hypothetical protein
LVKVENFQNFEFLKKSFHKFSNFKEIYNFSHFLKSSWKKCRNNSLTNQRYPPGRQIRFLNPRNNKENVDAYDNNAEQNGNDHIFPSIDEIAHNGSRRTKGNSRDCSERKLKRHDCIQVIIHFSDIVNLTKERYTESWNDGDGSGDKHSLPTLPLEIEETFHGKLNEN